MNDGEQRRFVVLLHEAHIQTGLPAQGSDIRAEVVAAYAACWIC